MKYQYVEDGVLRRMCTDVQKFELFSDNVRWQRMGLRCENEKEK
nr:hypothetical protein [uncultured Desulfobacter sp.]